MKDACVRVEQGVRGARRGGERGDVVVIIDALRASATIVAALWAGARKVLPVLTVREANAYLGVPGYRVAGERGGAKLPQFDYGNSPAEMWDHRQELAGQTLVLTTSNGTRCVQAALPGAACVLAGSTVNAGSVARTAWAFAGRAGRDITLAAAGLDGQPAGEDTFSAALIGERLARLGATLDEGWKCVREEDSLDVFLRSGSAARLTELGYAHDVRLVAQIDLWDLVPVYADGGFERAGQEGGDLGF
jgi:phosphosulfolactate phosphohydrolase-like enzyme